MTSRSTKDVISVLGSSCRSRYSGCSVAFLLPFSSCSYTPSGRLAMVSEITRTQAYTVDSWIALWAVTFFPEPLVPK